MRRRFTVWLDSHNTTDVDCMDALLRVGPELKTGIVVRRDGEEEMLHLYLPSDARGSEDA